MLCPSTHASAQYHRPNPQLPDFSSQFLLLHFLPYSLFLYFHRYLGDGRFHLESVMIANPGIPAYRYN